MTLCANCGTHIVPAPKFPAHPWRHADTGFLQCSHGDTPMWASPVEEPEPAA